MLQQRPAQLVRRVPIEQCLPTGAIRVCMIDFKECVRGDICEAKLIAKAGSCQHDVELINQRLLGLQLIQLIEN